jgi:hypothetical protein
MLKTLKNLWPSGISLIVLVAVLVAVAGDVQLHLCLMEREGNRRRAYSRTSKFEDS